MAQTSKYFNATSTTTTKDSIKTLHFNAVLKSAEPTDNGKAKLNFAVTNHPHRTEYSKVVSIKYLEDMFEIFNSYLINQLEEFDVDQLLDTLIEEGPELKMWSKTYFDRPNNKYVTDNSFIGK